MKYLLRNFFLAFFVWFPLLAINITEHAAVTYGPLTGRFGDQLLTYVHAKWISYKYGIPLLYKPFRFSKYLVLDDKEIPYIHSFERRFKNTISFSIDHDMNSFFNFFDPKESTLVTIPYFSEKFWLRQTDPLEVNFDDPEFRVLLKNFVAPKKPILFSINIPEERFSIAVHVRTGGARESIESLYREHPVKAPRSYFFVDQLRFLYRYLNERPLFVFIFTDDANPLNLQGFFEKEFAGWDIQFSCRTKKNAHNKNVLEDFFAMTRFNASIHGDSNYSNCAGFIADYKIEIRAISMTDEGVYRSRMRICHSDGSIEYIDI